MGQIAMVGKNGSAVMDEVEIDLARFEEVYEQLVDGTEDRAILRNEKKNQRLGDALALMEYLRGAEDENPVERWFE